MGTRALLGLLGLLALVAVCDALDPTIDSVSITELPDPGVDICRGPVSFETTLTLGNLTESTAHTITATPANFCNTTTPTFTTGAAETTKDVVYTCGFPAPGDNISTAVTFTVTGVDGSNPAILEFDLDADDTANPTFVSALVQVPRVRIFNLTQTPAFVPAGVMTQNISFDLTMEAGNITSNNTATRIVEGLNCTLISPNEGLDWHAADFYTMVSYRCDFNQRSMVPATLTFTGNTNITSPACYDSALLNLRSSIKELLNLTTTTPEQQCTPSGVINNSTLVEYRFTATLSGAKGGVTAPPNCTTTGSLNAYGVGTLPYVCRYLASNVSVSHTFSAFGDQNDTATITFPAAADARQPAVTIGTVDQTRLLPRTGGVNGNADTVQLLVPVAMERAADILAPDFCVAVTNLTDLLPAEFPGYTGTVTYNCTVPIASVTVVSAGSTTAPPMGQVDASLFAFKVTTAAEGCWAEDSRNQSVTHEPAVAVSIGTITQSCLAASTDPVTFKVPVTFTGAKGAHAASVPDAPAACKEAVGSLNSNGYGIITYDCTFATAAASNVTLNFTSTGLITGETRFASRRMPATVTAARPEVAVTKGPTQSTLLRYYDSTSSVDISLSVRFKGAVGGIFKSMGALCRTTNESSVLDTDGTLDFNCTFPKPADVPANFTFRSLTPAADCYAEAIAPFVVEREPRVYISDFTARQQCLAALTGPVEYDVTVEFEGAKANHTYPVRYCSEQSISLDANGTGAGEYTCTFANTTSLADLTFGSVGIIAGDTYSYGFSLEGAVQSAKPSVKIGGAVQDLLMAGDNTSEVKYTVSLTVSGAEVLSIDAEGGSCNATTVVPLYLQDPRLLKLVSTATTKLDLVCGFKNASVVPKSLTFIGHTNASGCIDEQYVNITVKRQAADEVKPYAYKMHFDGMSYAALMADAAKAQRFVEGVRSRVSLAVNLPIGNIQVVNLTEGSVIADVVLQTPATWTPDQVIAAANTLAAPADVFDATFLRDWDISAVTVTRQTELPAPTGLSSTAKLGIGVGVGVGGGALLGAGIGIALARKRRSAVEPRDMA